MDPQTWWKCKHHLTHELEYGLRVNMLCLRNHPISNILKVY